GFSNTLWMGFITMEGGNSSTHNISFYNGLNKVMVLSKSGYDNWDISIDGTGDPDNLPWQGQKNVIHFWVFKMEKGNNTKITVWRDISSEPTSGGTEITLPSFSFEKISVASDQLLFDELRIGTNFASIISSSSGTMINVTSVSVASSSASIAVGETKLLTPTVLPLNATNNSVTWQSNNSSVVTVSSDGLLTGISSGTATITVTTQDGGFAATCSVTVTENSTNLGFAKKDIVGALISPIPSKDLLNIRLVSFEKALTVQLYSSTGIELIKELHKNVNSLTLNVSRFPNGVYFIKMTNGAEMITRKVTISR
ncbi:MAG TPA: Ig-like domain-containing protein, partial [Paludibacter sp.]